MAITKKELSRLYEHLGKIIAEVDGAVRTGAMIYGDPNATKQQKSKLNAMAVHLEYAIRQLDQASLRIVEIIDGGTTNIKED